jgi:hypothetical protein
MNARQTSTSVACKGYPLLALSAVLLASATAAATDTGGTIVISADGDQVSYETTGGVGQAWGLYLAHRHTDPAVSSGWSWQYTTLAAGSTSFWASQGAGTYEVQVCEWNPMLQQLTVCSNMVDVTWVYDVDGHFVAIPADDPALETGTVTASLAGCEVAWDTTGTVGQAGGFLVLTQLDADPVYGTATARYAYPDQHARSLDHLYVAGRYHVSVCSYDFYRDELGACSEPVEFDLAWSNGLTCTPPEPALSTAIPPPYDAGLAAGLAAWRTPDVNGNSCASCHAPDGIDLAYPAYSREDILRRANNHVDPTTALAIADMIEAVRDHYGWVPTIDPREYRPFQPGGQPLPGVTALARDAAFADQLVQLGLLVATGDVDDLEDAWQARDELLDVDLWTLPVGIPFDRFSEDRFFGDAHGLLHEWVPSVGHVADEADPTTWLALQDLYLADPSEEALLELLETFSGPDRSVRLNQGDLRGGIESFEAERFRSLLLLSHEQRREMAGEPARGPDDIAPYASSAIWRTGRLAYDTWSCNPLHHGELEDCMQFPLAGLAPQPSFFDQMDAMSLAWHYAGWLFAQHLEDVPGEQSLLAGHYLDVQLKNMGYPSHHAFLRAMRTVRKFWGADQSWRSRHYYTTAEVPNTSAFADLVFMDHFMAQGNQGGHDLSYGPAAGPHREQYIRFTANMYKMLLLLLEDEIALTGQVYDRETLVEMLRGQADHRWYGPVDFLPVLVAHEPERALELGAWISDIADAAEAAEEVALVPGEP